MEPSQENQGLICPCCGSDLAGLTTAQCPTCGAALQVTVRTPSATHGVLFIRGGFWAVGGCIVLGLCCAAMGGRVHIDWLAAAILFLVGGLVRLGLRAGFGF